MASASNVMGAAGGKANDLLNEAAFGLDALERMGEEKADSIVPEGDSVAHEAAQTGTVLTVVTLGITILIGILIYGQIQSSLPSPGNSDLQNASDNSTSTFADAMELAPVIMLVLLASVVLAVVQRFR